MQTVRIETSVDENGEVHLTQLPFKVGDPAEVIVRPRMLHPGDPLPLRGLAIEYERPMIVATGRVYGAAVATADDKILRYPRVKTLRIGG